VFETFSDVKLRLACADNCYMDKQDPIISAFRKMINDEEVLQAVITFFGAIFL